MIDATKSFLGLMGPGLDPALVAEIHLLLDSWIHMWLLIHDCIDTCQVALVVRLLLVGKHELRTGRTVKVKGLAHVLSIIEEI